HLLQHVWKHPFDTATLTAFKRLPERFLAPPVPLGARCFERRFSSYYKRGSEASESIRANLLGFTIQRTEDSPDPDVLGLDAKQARFYETSLRTPHSEAELCMSSGLSGANTLFMLATLRDLKFLDVQRIDHAETARRKRRERLEGLHARLDKDDAFKLFELHWSTYSEEIERTCPLVIAEYDDPKSFADLGDVAQIVRELRDALHEAFRALRSSSKRAQLRRKLVDQATIENHVSMYQRQASSALLRHDLEGAIDINLRILELRPGEATARHDLERLFALREKRRAHTTNS
ncbi:MAG: hypothetical protein AAGI01_14655, partial [Myxococcota bacterium]